MSLGEDFRSAIAAADRALASLAEAQTIEPLRQGGWSRKQILGHLLDSAAHNHVRFLTAANEGSVQVNEYDQPRCVALHAYGELPWSELVAHWRSHNEMITRVVERLPPAGYNAPCSFKDGSQFTLEELIRDYLLHLNHHIQQISGAQS
jgi:hypothetical protein